jgi:putative nucleotidyltransferase with HDIG domain
VLKCYYYTKSVYFRGEIYLYRVKQFIWAINSVFKPIDNKLINKYLTEDEKVIFNNLSKSEKHHSIRVCNKVLSLYETKYMNLDKSKLAKIALLHDIGKSEKHLNIVDKSLLVILNKISKGKLEKYNSVKKINIYYNHGKKSVDLLKTINKYDLDILQAIEYHHNNDITDNLYLEILKKCDNES